ncbi:hypothetical protein EV644_10481 [Kribbella orskensis]|uniref:DUF4386 family protein n=1 Tax=Kribbella orskensis TaxID=2512216 RepID=A0ABY2BMX6_9ACTN|nr:MULTISPECIES: hypothetical protein [Kribbella]TCN41699.1 hypothetical protein EV642_10381 [Kribbella sp. VKM Ac-2500]TCO25577.1 hypothetical protein EV644_10481 [Kribbella orskensis]
MTSTKEFALDARDPLVRTATTRRVGLALAMFLAPWLIVGAEVGHAVTTLHGGDDLEPSGDLALTGEHLTLDRWASLAALAGALLLVPAVLGVMRLVRVRAARLGLVGGVLTAAAYVCYFAMVFQGFTTAAMVKAGGSTSQNVTVLQAVLDEPLTRWVYLLFVLGNLLGTFLLGLALVRAHTANRLAGFGLMAWPVFHAISFPFSDVIGTAVQAIGFGLAAMALLRRRDPRTEPEPYELLRR